MKTLVFYFLLIVLLAELISLFVINKPKSKDKVLSVSVSLSPVPTLSPSPTPSPSPSPTPKPTPTKSPTPSPIPQPTFSSQQINEFIDKYGGQYSVSPDILRHIALCESGFNPLAKKLSYAGLYQFGPNTWKGIRTKMGEKADIDLRFNAEEAVKTAAYNLHINNAGIWPNCVP